MPKIKKILDNKNGMASLLAIGLLVLFTALGVACLLSASALVRNTQQTYIREQAKIYAVTLSQQIEKELTSVGNILTKHSTSSLSNYLFENMTVFNKQNGNTGLWDYYDSTSNWGNHSNKSMMTRTFECNGSDFGQEGATAEIDIYWESTASAMSENTEENDKIRSVVLNVTVRVTYKNETYADTVKYEAAARSNTEATWNKGY